MQLTMRDWKTGNIVSQYNLEDYEKTWGNVYNMLVLSSFWRHLLLTLSRLHRQDMHAALLDAATSDAGKGTPCQVFIDHMYVSPDKCKFDRYWLYFSCESVDYDTGTITFRGGAKVSADLIIGADGIRVSLSVSLGSFSHPRISLLCVHKLVLFLIWNLLPKHVTVAMSRRKTSNALAWWNGPVIPLCELDPCST